WYLKLIGGTALRGLTPVLLIGMLVGLKSTGRSKVGYVFHWWFIACALFFFIAGRGSRHIWYQLPFVPVAAALVSIRDYRDLPVRRVIAIGAVFLTCSL